MVRVPRSIAFSRRRRTKRASAPPLCARKPQKRKCPSSQSLYANFTASHLTPFRTETNFRGIDILPALKRAKNLETARCIVVADRTLVLNKVTNEIARVRAPVESEYLRGGKSNSRSGN